jgi:hypothetical protein
MSHCLIAILIFGELKAGAGERVEAVDTGPIARAPIGHPAYLVPRGRAFR